MTDCLQCFESASGKRCLAATLHRYGKWPMIDGFTMFYILKNADFPSAHVYIYMSNYHRGPANNKNEVMGSMLIRRNVKWPNLGL